LNSLAQNLASSEVRDEVVSSPAWEAYHKERVFLQRQKEFENSKGGNKKSTDEGDMPNLIPAPVNTETTVRPTEISFRDGIANRITQRDAEIENLVNSVFGEDTLVDGYQNWLSSGVQVPEDGIKGYKRFMYSLL